MERADAERIKFAESDKKKIDVYQAEIAERVAAIEKILGDCEGVANAACTPEQERFFKVCKKRYGSNWTARSCHLA